jgi:hypothetical protein
MQCILLRDLHLANRYQNNDAEDVFSILSALRNKREIYIDDEERELIFGKSGNILAIDLQKALSRNPANGTSFSIVFGLS